VLSPQRRILEGSSNERLVLSQVHFQPRAITGTKPLTVRILVVDSSGKPVSGALVKVVGVPFGRVTGAAEVKTAANGWATVKLRPRASLGRGLLTFFLRGRLAGQPVLAGASTRRLVAIRVR
jgi:hypothetical protein